MKKIKFPIRQDWEMLTGRPSQDLSKPLEIAEDVFSEIRKEGDSAVKKYTKRFDGADLQSLAVPVEKLKQAAEQISSELKSAIEVAKNNIEKFHTAQKEKPLVTETSTGVNCWRKSVAIQKVGIYIPGGTAPLFSTVLMLGIPAKIAGCKDIVLCTPPNSEGEINPAILYTANILGITKVFAVGGIQAIGAMTFGTESVPKVDKIFGPGNQYVTAAKQLAQNCGVAIDMLAGPSELLVIADDYCVPEFVAADLLSQAEHGSDSQVILLSDNENIIDQVLLEVSAQLKNLPRKDIAVAALENSKAILLQNIDDCIDFSNIFAPEHLILANKNFRETAEKITNAGSVFLGNFSCESAGDYASGTNHTLPTNGYARNTAGVSLDSFVKKITFQELSETGIKNLGPVIEKMAEAEALEAHKNAVTIRLNKLQNV
jgi:histidinol dehydrogenase